MKRQRVVTILLAVACVVLAGVTLREFSVPIVGPASAQSGGDAAPDFGSLKPASAPVRKAAAAAVRAQLDAFKKDDYRAAVKYQSSALKGNFPSITQFRQMITTTYPEFAHYKTVLFKDVRMDATGRHVLAQVTLTGQDGVTLNAVYMMVRENGGYKVDGVAGGGRTPLPAAPGVSVDS